MKIDSPRVIIPQGYRSLLSIMETEFAIKLLKDFLRMNLQKSLTW